MRIEWSVDAFDLAEAAFRKEFVRIAQEFKMAWRLAWFGPRLRIAIFVSRYQHCLIDLLHRNQIGELAGDVAMVVSNHREAEQLASFYGIPFHHFPKAAEDRLDVEKREMELLESNQ